MIEKNRIQENLPENMSIIPILKIKKLIFLRLSLFSHVKPFLLSTTSFRYHIFFPKFSLTESDTVGPQLFTWTKKSRRSHQSAEIFFNKSKFYYLLLVKIKIISFFFIFNIGMIPIFSGRFSCFLIFSIIHISGGC